MKHIQSYYNYITEGKKQTTYGLKVNKNFNVFDLLNDLKKHGAELLGNQPGAGKDEIVITVAMDDSKKAKAEDEIRKVAEIIDTK